MSDLSRNLIEAALQLVARRAGQRGPLAGAFIRRSISTSYYALFHFLVEQATASVMGATVAQTRRRALARSFTHAGLRTAMDKVKGRAVNGSVQSLFMRAAGPDLAVPVPTFVRNLAEVFLDAQTMREAADYDLSEPLGEADARALRLRVSRAMDAWEAATAADARDFKHSVCVLLLMKGQIR